MLKCECFITCVPFPDRGKQLSPSEPRFAGGFGCSLTTSNLFLNESIRAVRVKVKKENYYLICLLQFQGH